MLMNIQKAGVAILTSDRLDFKPNAVTRDEEHYIILKGSIQPEDIILVNICKYPREEHRQ